MALSSLRLRRALAFSSSFFRNPRSFSSITSFSSSSSISSSSTVPQHTRNHSKIQSHSFRSSLPSFSSRSSYNNNDDDKISPDTILFEGCDYNHWLITMDFPKDPKPTPEEMVETYVQTLAKVVGSVEEAKKRMYACSTTTYNGFQAVMTEEMSEKFRGLPGVVFILPDSYIDPVNKEYGGDKYIDGTIIPRPPPVQYGRSQGRYGDRNRNYDRPRYDGQRTPMPMQQGNQQYDRQAPMQGDGRNQPFDRQAPMQGDGRNQPFDRQAPMQGDGRNQPFDRQAPIQGDGRNQPFDRQAPMQGDGRNQPFDRQAPMQGDGRNQPFDRQAPMQGDGRHQPFDRQAPMPGVGGNFGNQQNYTPQPNYGHPGQGARDSMPMGGQDYAPGGFGRDNNQGDRRGPVPPPNFGGADRGSFSQGQRDLTQGDRRVYTPAGQGDFRPPPSGGYGQGDASGFRQGYPGPGEGQSFQQVQSDGRPGFEQGGYNPMGQTRNEQGRY